MLGLAVTHDDVAAGDRRSERPGAGDDPVRHHAVLDRCSCRRRPTTSRVDVRPGRRSARPSPRASGRGRRSRARGRRSRSRWCPRASTAAISRFSVAPTLGKSSRMVGAHQAPRRRGDQEPVLDRHLGAERRKPADVQVQAAGADGVAAGQRDLGAAAAGEQRAEHGRSRRAARAPARSRPGARAARRARRSATTPAVGGQVDRAAEATQQLGHDRGRRGCRARRGSVVTPWASRAAAISLSTQFLAPATRTAPATGSPTTRTPTRVPRRRPLHERCQLLRTTHRFRVAHVGHGS